MAPKKDASYYTSKYPGDYMANQGELGCCWCFKLIPFEQADSHLKNPEHIENKQKGLNIFFVVKTPAIVKSNVFINIVMFFAFYFLCFFLKPGLNYNCFQRSVW